MKKIWEILCNTIILGVAWLAAKSVYLYLNPNNGLDAGFYIFGCIGIFYMVFLGGRKWILNK